MTVDWLHEVVPFALGPSVDVGSDGVPVLDIVRLSRGGESEWRMKVVAEADGPVLSAMVDPRGNEEVNASGCTFGSYDRGSLSQRQQVFFVADGEIDSDYREAVVGGAADELHPRAQWVWNHSGGIGLAASDELWASSDGVRIGVARWGEPWQQVFHGSEAGGLQQFDPNLFHDFVTWESSDDLYVGIMAYTPERGAYPFLTYPGDWSQGADGLGTDGLDMVWTHSEGKGPANEAYPAGSVMTAPFTTDPATLEPRRVRSYPSPHYSPVDAWEVGCGYAAVEWEAGKVIIVRLADGWSWQLETPNPEAPPLERWFFSTVYALDCEEIFLRGHKGSTAMNIARVRLDALGAGVPPD